MDNFKEEITVNKYPVYKDLEPYKEYEYDTVNNIHQDIIKIISTIEKNCSKNEDEIKRGILIDKLKKSSDKLQKC